ncbi:zinc finger protein 488-like [Haliotis cracherodii]|uniref:zinc finger protein 488-like n=1 Tax=Haliotis cracherodii TaxID=6455 RepID=UPI0039EAD11B
MGVVPVSDIDYGQIFGPFPSHLAMADPAYLIAMLTNDKRQDGVIIKLDLSERKEGIKAVDWLPYIHPARNEEEQNVEAYMKEGQVYYRTLRIVKAGEELLVWYSKDFCQLLNIPDVKRHIPKDEGFICPQCGEVFEHVFPMRAHLKFRCTMRAADMRSLIQDASAKRHLEISEFRSKERVVSDNYKCETDLLRDSIPNRSGDSPDSIPLELSPRRKDISESHTSRKRHSSTNISPPEKKNCTESKSSVSSMNRDIDVERLSPPSTKRNDFDNHSDGASAFRKVEKSMSPVQEQLSPIHHPVSSSSVSLSNRMSVHNAIRGPSMSMASSTASHPAARDAMQQSQLLGLYMPRIPLMPQLPLSANLAASTAMYAERTPVRFAEMCRTQAPGPLTESFANVRNSDSNSELFVKQQQLLFAERASMSYPAYLKSQNPMVEKMIHSGTNPTQINSPVAAMDLSQNWCAKCNATFRMTSDLVYHMRSHHKREFDPVKKKRDDKLRCNICSETFRERHHLTRHMTSHV